MSARIEVQRAFRCSHWGGSWTLILAYPVVKGTLVTGKGLVTGNLESVALEGKKERGSAAGGQSCGMEWGGCVPLYRPRWVAQAFETRCGGDQVRGRWPIVLAAAVTARVTGLTRVGHIRYLGGIPSYPQHTVAPCSVAPCPTTQPYKHDTERRCRWSPPSHESPGRPNPVCHPAC